MSGGRFEEIADKHLDVKVRGSVEFMTACPFCEGESSLQFNIDKGLWVCFRCDEKGNAKRLVRRLGGVYADPAVSTEHIRKRIDQIRMRAKNREKGRRVLDETYLARYRFPDDYWTDDRGLSETTVEKFNLGYDPISDRHTIPYRDERGSLLGIIQRLKGDVFPRYIYPKEFDRLGSFFGSWFVNGHKASLVEGSTDVLALYDAGIPNSLAQYGSSLSMRQVRLLHRLGVREVVLFYDYDEAGRKAEEKSRERLAGFVIRSVVWDHNKYCWHKKFCGCGDHDWRSIGKCKKKRLCKCGRKHEMDPGSLTKKEIRRMYDNAVLVGSKRWRR